MDGQSLHIKAEEAREKGEFLDALKLTDEATVAYQQEGNIVKLAEVQASRALTLRHLYEKTQDRNFAVLAKFAAKSGVKIAEKNDDKGIAIPLYVLGKCYESLGEWDDAKEEIEHAIKHDEDLNPATLAEMKTRLAAVSYRLGEDSMPDFEAAYIELEKSDQDDYTKKVWLSGAHMHMAEAHIAKGEKDQALSHVTKAKEIISADERLKLRIAQLSKIEEKLK